MFDVEEPLMGACTSLEVEKVKEYTPDVVPAKVVAEESV